MSASDGAALVKAEVDDGRAPEEERQAAAAGAAGAAGVLLCSADA